MSIINHRSPNYRELSLNSAGSGPATDGFLSGHIEPCFWFWTSEVFILLVISTIDVIRLIFGASRSSSIKFKQEICYVYPTRRVTETKAITSSSGIMYEEIVIKYIRSLRNTIAGVANLYFRLVARIDPPAASLDTSTEPRVLIEARLHDF